MPKISIICYGMCYVTSAWKFYRDTPFWFLYYNRTPGAKLIFGEREIFPDKDKLLLIPPHTTFTTACDTPFDHLYIHFAAEKPFTDVKPEPLLFDQMLYRHLIDKLYNDGFENNPMTAYGLICSLLSQLPADYFPAGNEHRDDKISIALTHFQSGKNNSQLSAALGMSTGNFQRRFKQEMGMPPKQYALHLRMEEAKKLLQSSELSIPEIAVKCGFSDRYAFSKAFKKYSGCSPGAFRQLASDLYQN